MATSKRSPFYFGELDSTTIWLYIALVLVGWWVIFTANYDPNVPLIHVFDLNNNAGKQLFFIVICFALIFVILMTDWAFWRTYALPIYLLTIVMLPGTLIFGREVNGAMAWYQFGGFSFQPSELAKFGTCLAMAGYLSSTGVDLREWRSRIFAFMIFLLPVAIILAQSDTGSALIFFSFMLVMYREGLSADWYKFGILVAGSVILGLAAPPPYVMALYVAVLNFLLIARFRENIQVWWLIWGTALLATFWWPALLNWSLPLVKIDPAKVSDLEMYVLLPHGVLLAVVFLKSYWKKNSMIQRELQMKMLLLALSCGLVFAANFAFTKVLAPYQQQRINIWLNPSKAANDARGSAYNLLHSKMAIGSGGFWGKGLLEGNMTRLKYVPEQTTDFIFCTVGEEQGFVGVLGLVGLFTALLIRITALAERQRSNFSRIYAYGVAGIIFVHFLVNIGMTMGLFPIIGIPLPFLSYGGSSLIGFTLMIGVLLKLDSNRNLA